MAKCCKPLPGEPIVGFITRGRGITVHRKSCKNTDKGDSERRIEVQWDTGEGNVYPVDIKVIYSKQRGMLAALSGVLGQLDVNVLDIKPELQGDRSNMCRLRLEVRDTKHLNRVLAALRAEKGVFRVLRAAES
jgi:GTP pyrophosphokinase